MSAPATDLARSGLDVLSAEIESCRRCPRLVAWREEVAQHPRRGARTEDYWARPVPGWGDPSAGLVVVGLAPAAHGANRTGRMFTGDRSGDWLYRAMWRAGFADRPVSEARGDGLTLSGAWITASARCAPPANKATPEELANCRPFLERELDLLRNGRVLVALGQVALRTLATVLDVRPRPRFAHLAEHRLDDGRHLLCSYHPSQQNTFTGVLTEEMFDAVFERARALLGADRPGSR
jgi:uracil-DNA glycosylase